MERVYNQEDMQKNFLSMAADYDSLNNAYQQINGIDESINIITTS